MIISSKRDKSPTFYQYIIITDGRLFVKENMGNLKKLIEVAETKILPEVSLRQDCYGLWDYAMGITASAGRS